VTQLEEEQMTHRRLTIALALTFSALALPAARADGGPSPGVTLGWDGLVAPGGAVRYVALPAGASTTLAVISTRTGRVQNFILVPGHWGVPTVAFDGSTAGLARDGRTLVLGEQPRGPVLRARSSFAVLSTKLLRLQRVIRLRGDFSFDALSPDARTLYLIQHISPLDLTQYLVRAYDMKSHALLPQVIADRRSVEKAMAGYPLSRATSEDGSWVFTLYRNDGGRPFIHALDAAKRQAVCIDLPWSKSKSQDRLWKLRFAFSTDRRQLLLAEPHARPAFVIDTRTMRVLR
jgi:hypothetical protein